MPEGDTIARAATVLHAALAGLTVTAFESALAPVASAAETHALVGRVIDGAASHGKHLVITFGGDLRLRTHMRMHGSWHLYRPGERWQRSPRAMRLRIDTPRWVAVAFDVYDAELTKARDVRRVDAVGRLGPDLLAAEVDVPAAAARLRAEGPRAMGDVLLDQRVVAGIGNVIRSEVLFLSGLSPRVPAAAVTPDVAETLVRDAVRILRWNAEPGRGPRRATGRMRRDEALWVYGRTGEPCRRCGTAIQSEMAAATGRRAYWCPRCQPPPG